MSQKDPSGSIMRDNRLEIWQTKFGYREIRRRPSVIQCNLSKQDSLMGILVTSWGARNISGWNLYPSKSFWSYTPERIKRIGKFLVEKEYILKTKFWS